MEKIVRAGSYLLVVVVCAVPWLLLDSLFWAALLTAPTLLVALLAAEHFYNFALRKRAP